MNSHREVAEFSPSMAGRPAVGPYQWMFHIQISAKHGGGLIEAALPSCKSAATIHCAPKARPGRSPDFLHPCVL